MVLCAYFSDIHHIGNLKRKQLKKELNRDGGPVELNI